MESHDFAWAAGFFDGEGWANRSGRGVQSRINQAGPDGIPEVLTKFRQIVGVGRIKGPVIVDGKQPLYYWEATSRSDLIDVVERIGPWLCAVKRAEFERKLGTEPSPDAEDALGHKQRAEFERKRATEPSPNDQ